MWLLHTSTSELVHFNSPCDVKGGYAVLSHVWQEHEMSFQELHALRSQLTATHPTPRSLASAKIRECCMLAESHGYEWLWIDTCCIDRSSSAELSEAINSMFTWYSQAQVCYAYLYDVPSSEGLARRDSPFRHSKWFTRGWTLQELIAPRDVVFFSQDWKMLGTKASLASLLEEITGIDADVLTFHRKVADVSVARRMWWASTRKTTRIEDQAYSLMGLFGVHMPTIYGEGARAFKRLQEEILKRTSDQSLFAWGNVLPVGMAPFRERMTYSNYHDDSHLFAPSPASFCNSANMVPIPLHIAAKHVLTSLRISPHDLELGKKRPRGSTAPTSYSIPLPDFVVTSQGIRSKMLVIESSVGNAVLAVAVLACKDESTGSCIGLLFRRRRYKESKLKYPRYHIGVTIRGNLLWMRLRYRMAQVEWAAHALSFGKRDITVQWKTLYISHRASSHQREPRGILPAAFRFYFPKWLEVELRKQGFQPDVPLPTARYAAHKLSDGGRPASFVFTHYTLGEAFRIHVGQCNGSPWATAHIATSTPPTESVALRLCSEKPRIDSPPALRPVVKPSFDCSKNQVASWDNGTRTFGEAHRSVQLTFTRMNEGATHLLDVRVGGHFFRGFSERGRRALHTLCRLLPRAPF